MRRWRPSFDPSTARLGAILRDWDPVAAVGRGVAADARTETIVSCGLPGVVPS